MEKKFKVLKILIIVIFIIICILAICYFLISKKTNNNSQNINNNTPTDTTPIEVQKDIQEVKARDIYYIIKNVSKRYFEYVNEYNTDSYYSKAEGEVQYTEEDKKALYEIIYKLLDDSYIKKNNVTDKEISNILSKYKNADDFDIKKMYYNDEDENNTIFYLDISLMKENKLIGKKEVIVGRLDRKNGLFGIIPVQLDNDKILQNNLKVSTEEMEKNTYNQYQFKNIDDIQMVDDLLVKYKNAVLYNRKEGYELLDKDYREKRFGDYNTFSKYVENNIKEISSMTFTKYLVNTGDDYKEYVCKDQYENLYIFHEKAVMDCTVTLDTYTLDNDTFNEKYNSSSTQYKVMMNIDKVRQMMNARDYRTMFNYLDETFRTTYFENDEDKFEEYMRYQFSSHYTFEFGEYSDESGVSIQEVTMKDMNENNNGDIGERFYMQLNEGTDFVMSFNVIGK